VFDLGDLSDTHSRRGDPLGAHPLLFWRGETRWLTLDGRAVVSTDTDKNAALCSATSTSPMTRSTMKLSRIISRAERAR
jgi:hypothetical protein